MKRFGFAPACFAGVAGGRSLDPTGIVSRWAASRAPFGWIVLICVLVVVPAISLRAAHFEEGTTIGIARDAFEAGEWLAPHRLGVRFVERPVLLSWMLGLLGLATGHLTDWMARIPSALSLLAGAGLVYRLVRQQASTAAGLFGALCFVASPIVLLKASVAESDLFLSVLLFCAFVVLWAGEARGGASLLRWLAVGALLSLASLVKGPQPLAFFFLGMGAFFLLQRRWTDFVKLGLVGLLPATVCALWYYAVYQPGDLSLWEGHSRLIAVPPARWLFGSVDFFLNLMIQLLPGWLLLVPFLSRELRDRRPDAKGLFVALLLYAFLCTAVLTFWPGARGRYVLPAALAIASAAGLAFDRLQVERPSLVRLAGVLIMCFLAYQVTLNWIVMPLAPDLFQRARLNGHAVSAAMATRPDTLYVSSGVDDTASLVYVPYRVRLVPLKFIASAPAPLWAIVAPGEEARLRVMTSRPVIVHVTSRAGDQWQLVEVGPSPAHGAGDERSGTPAR